MKRKTLILKNEKYFNFSKMDKKNVQKIKTQIFYGNSVDCDHNLKLRCGYKKNNFNFVMVIFL